MLARLRCFFKGHWDDHWFGQNVKIAPMSRIFLIRKCIYCGKIEKYKYGQVIYPWKQRQRY